MRVVLAEDSVLLRQGLVALLTEHPAVAEVIEAGDLGELLSAVSEQEPDVVLADIRMPPTHTDEGVRAALRIRQAHPGVGVIVLSQYAEPEYAMELLADGTDGVGYLLKDRIAEIDDFSSAVRRVAQGGSALDSSIVSQLVARKRRAAPLEVLSAREREVLALMAEGRSNAAIARRLVVTEAAVAKHIGSLLTKLDLPPDADDHRRVRAVLAYLRG